MSTPMSNEYMFGVTNGVKFSAREKARRDKIAKKHGGPSAFFVNPEMPEGYRAWFGIQNRGAPYDSQKSELILADVYAGGHLASIGKKGGAAGTGAAKARTPEQARAAALKRWSTPKLPPN